MKKAQIFHTLLPLRQRLQLRVIADQEGYSMAWIVRALLRAYRREYRRPPKIDKKRNGLKGPHVRFNIVFYGDKEIYFQWVRAAGLELAPVVREIVDFYLSGKFVVDLSSPDNLKKEKKETKRKNRKKDSSTGYASAYHIAGENYVGADFRPISHENNRWLMERGLRNKKQSYVRMAIFWYRDCHPEDTRKIAT